jgi:hypothetical protein
MSAETAKETMPAVMQIHRQAIVGNQLADPGQQEIQDDGDQDAGQESFHCRGGRVERWGL